MLWPLVMLSWAGDAVEDHIENFARIGSAMHKKHRTVKLVPPCQVLVAKVKRDAGISGILNSSVCTGQGVSATALLICRNAATTTKKPLKTARQGVTFPPCWPQR